MISGRRLPQTPTEATYTNGRYNSPYNGSSVNVQQSSQQNQGYYRPSTGSSAETPTVNMPMPMPDPNGGGGSTWRPPTGQNDVGRYPSSRPSTTSSHTQRGAAYDYGYDDQPFRSPDSLDEMYTSPDTYGPTDSLRRDDTVSSHHRGNSVRSFQAATPASLYPGVCTSYPSLVYYCLTCSNYRLSSSRPRHVTRYRIWQFFCVRPAWTRCTS